MNHLKKAMETLLFKFNIKNKGDFLALMWQVIKFGIVGCSNTLIALAIYWILEEIGVYYLIAFAIGEIISILNAYIWSNFFVFKKEDAATRNHKKSFVKVCIVYISTFLLAELLLYLQVDCLSWPAKRAAVLNLLVTIPINFLLNKFWAFKDEKGE